MAGVSATSAADNSSLRCVSFEKEGPILRRLPGLDGGRDSRPSPPPPAHAHSSAGAPRGRGSRLAGVPDCHFSCGLVVAIFLGQNIPTTPGLFAKLSAWVTEHSSPRVRRLIPARGGSLCYRGNRGDPGCFFGQLVQAGPQGAGLAISVLPTVIKTTDMGLKLVPKAGFSMGAIGVRQLPKFVTIHAIKPLPPAPSHPISPPVWCWGLRVAPPSPARATPTPPSPTLFLTALFSPFWPQGVFHPIATMSVT